MRRIGYPLRLARARLLNRGARPLLVVAGILAGAAALAAVDGGSVVMQDRNLAASTARLPVEDRVVQATWFGSTGQGEGDWRTLDRTVRPALRGIGGEPIAAMLFKEAQIDGHLVDVRAVDGLARWVRLRSGRLPAACSPSLCEVLQVAGDGPIPSVPGLRLERVGTAVVDPDAPFRAFVGRPTDGVPPAGSSLRYHTPPQPPLLLAEGVAGLSRTTELSTFYRSYAWIAPLAAGSIHPWSLGELAGRVDRARSQLRASTDRFDVTAPTDALTAADASGRAAARRLLLLGGEAAALLLAFTLLAAASMRRDVEAARQRLRWYGARRWQLELMTGAEAAGLALAGAVAGWACGVGIAVLVARAAGSPGGGVLAHSAVSGTGLALAAGLAVVAAVVLALAVRAPALRLGGLALTPLDVAALGALLAIVLELARGGTDAGALASRQGTGASLLLLPALVAFVAAVACARALGPLLRGLERAGRRGPLAGCLAALSLARAPGHAAVAATFLVVSLGLALFAATYGSTLARGQTAQASYAVPADAILREDLGQLVPVADAVTPDRLASIGATSAPVIRLSGDVSRVGSSSGFTVLGIPRGRLATLDGWRGDFASRSRTVLAARLDATRLRTVPIAGTTLALDAAGQGDRIGARAIVESPAGTFSTLRLGTTDAPRLVAAVPPGSRLVGLRFSLLNGGRLAAEGGTGVQPIARGVLRLSGVDFHDWIGEGGVRVLGDGRIAYLLTTQLVGGFRPRQPTDAASIHALVSPSLARTAGPDGKLPLLVEGQPLTVQVVGVVRRFPSTTGDVLVADEGSLATALNTALPGLGVPGEAWLNLPAGISATRVRAAFPLLEVASQAELRHDLRSDPLARGALLTLAATAVLALVLALVGLLLGLVADLRDEGGDLFDLEAQGAAPALLRRYLRLRTTLVAAVGAIGGIVTGVVLSSLVLDLVTLTASAGTPEPPLALAVRWPWLLLAALLYLLLAAALVAALTHGAFCSRTAGRFREVGT